MYRTEENLFCFSLSDLFHLVVKEHHLNQGVVFLQEKELLITGNHWNLIIDIDVKSFRNAVNVLKIVWKSH
jgi:glutamine cyclotransferase